MSAFIQEPWQGCYLRISTHIYLNLKIKSDFSDGICVIWLLIWLDHKDWLCLLDYMTGIFHKLNKLNLQLQSLHKIHMKHTQKRKIYPLKYLNL